MVGSTSVGKRSAARATFIALRMDAVHAGDPLTMGNAACWLEFEPVIRSQGFVHCVETPVSVQRPVEKKFGDGERFAEGSSRWGASVAPAGEAAVPKRKEPRRKREAVPRRVMDRGTIVSKLMTR